MKISNFDFFPDPVTVASVNKSKYLSNVKQNDNDALDQTLQSPLTSAKKKKKQKRNPSTQEPVLNGVSAGNEGTPKKENSKKQNAAETSTDVGNLKTPKSSMKQKKNSPKAGSNNVTDEVEQPMQTPKQNRLSEPINSTKKSATKMNVQTQAKTPKKGIEKEAVIATPSKQSKTPKKSVSNDVGSTPHQSKTPKKPTENEVSTPKQSKTPKKPTPNEAVSTPTQSKTPKKQVVNNVEATPKQPKTPKNQNNTPAVASKTPQTKQQLQTPKSSKHTVAGDNITADNVEKSGKKAKQSSSPSASDQQKSINLKKNMKSGKVEVDSLSDSFALKVKAKMNKKKPVKKIGNLKVNKKPDEAKKTGFKGKMEKGKKR